jgi:hypothetical protein
MERLPFSPSASKAPSSSKALQSARWSVESELKDWFEFSLGIDKDSENWTWDLLGLGGGKKR